MVKTDIKHLFFDYSGNLRTAGWLATASWLSRSFATAAWLFFCTASWLAAVAAVLSHHTSEDAFEASAASCSVAAVNHFCTANWLSRSFAAARRLFFCTTNWLACIASISFTKTKQTERVSVG